MPAQSTATTDTEARQVLIVQLLVGTTVMTNTGVKQVATAKPRQATILMTDTVLRQAVIDKLHQATILMTSMAVKQAHTRETLTGPLPNMINTAKNLEHIKPTLLAERLIMINTVGK